MALKKAEQLSKMYHGYDDDDEDYDEDEDNESEDYSGNESDFSDSSHWMKTMVQPSNTNVPKEFLESAESLLDKIEYEDDPNQKIEAAFKLDFFLDYNIINLSSANLERLEDILLRAIYESPFQYQSTKHWDLRNQLLDLILIKGRQTSSHYLHELFHILPTYSHLSNPEEKSMVHAILCCIGKIGRRQSGRLLQLLSPHPEFLSCLEPIAKFVISNLESIYMHPPSDFFDDDILYTAELAKHLLRITHALVRRSDDQSMLESLLHLSLSIHKLILSISIPCPTNFNNTDLVKRFEIPDTFDINVWKNRMELDILRHKVWFQAKARAMHLSLVLCSSDMSLVEGYLKEISPITVKALLGFTENVPRNLLELGIDFLTQSQQLGEFEPKLIDEIIYKLIFPQLCLDIGSEVKRNREDHYVSFVEFLSQIPYKEPYFTNFCTFLLEKLKDDTLENIQYAALRGLQGIAKIDTTDTEEDILTQLSPLFNQLMSLLSSNSELLRAKSLQVYSELLSDEILGEELEEKSKCILTALDDSSDIVREMAVSILPDTFWLLRDNMNEEEMCELLVKHQQFFFQLVEKKKDTEALLAISELISEIESRVTPYAKDIYTNFIRILTSFEKTENSENIPGIIVEILDAICNLFRNCDSTSEIFAEITLDIQFFLLKHCSDSETQEAWAGPLIEILAFVTAKCPKLVPGMWGLLPSSFQNDFLDHRYESSGILSNLILRDFETLLSSEKYVAIVDECVSSAILDMEISTNVEQYSLSDILCALIIQVKKYIHSPRLQKKFTGGMGNNLIELERILLGSPEQILDSYLLGDLQDREFKIFSFFLTWGYNPMKIINVLNSEPLAQLFVDFGAIVLPKIKEGKLSLRMNEILIVGFVGLLSLPGTLLPVYVQTVTKLMLDLTFKCLTTIENARMVENKEELLEVDEDFGQLSCFVPANEHFLFKYWDESVFIVNSFQRDANTYQSLKGLFTTEQMDVWNRLVEISIIKKSPVSMAELCIEFLAFNLQKMQDKIERLPLDLIDKLLEFIHKNRIDVDPEILKKLQNKNL